MRGRTATRLLIGLGVLGLLWLALSAAGVLEGDLRGDAAHDGSEIQSLADLERELYDELTQGPALRGLPGMEHRVTGEGVVKGRVALHGGVGGARPLPGVRVQLLGRASEPEGEPVRLRFAEESAADGTFTFEEVPARAGYIVIVDHAPYRRIVLRGLAVAPAQAADVGTLTLGAPTSLHGQVVDSRGRGVAGAVVQVLRDRSRKDSFDARRALFEVQNQDGYLAQARVASDGSFLLADLPPGRYLLRIGAAGYATTFRSGVLVTVDENSSDVRIVLDRGAGLAGKVVDETGRGIGGARVIAIAIPGRHLKRLDKTEVTSAQDGSYRLDTLIPGVNYGIEAWAEGYAPTGRFMPIKEGVARQDWKLEQSGRIEGRVVDEETGVGVAECQVTVLAGPMVGAALVSATTDEAGGFVLPHVNAGPILMFSAKAPGYQSRDEFTFASVRGMRVVAGETLWIDWQVRAGGRVEGRITSDAGKPVPYANVALVDRDRGRQRWTGEITGVTDALGRYRMVGVRPGQYDLRASAAGYAPPTASEATHVAMSAVLGAVTKDLVLRRGGTLEGTVTAPDGNPVGGARVSIEPGDERTSRDSLRDLFAVSTGNGTFRIVGVPPGIDVLASAEHDTYVRSEASRTRLTPGQARRLTLKLREGGRLPGRVVDARGAPVSGAQVRWGHVDGVRARDLRTSFEADEYLGSRVLRTDADGGFVVPGLAPGTYLLKVAREGFSSWYRRDVRIAGEGLHPALTVELESTLTIRGRVTSRATGTPLARAFVYARERGAPEGRPEDPGRVQAIVSGETDEQGRYVLDQVPPGTHEVVVWFAEGHVAAAQGWRNETVKRKDVPAGAKGIDFVLEPIPLPEASDR